VEKSTKCVASKSNRTKSSKLEQKLESVAAALRRANRVLFMTGADISADRNESKKWQKCNPRAPKLTKLTK
jgi:hypothetical protein